MKAKTPNNATARGICTVLVNTMSAINFWPALKDFVSAIHTNSRSTTTTKNITSSYVKCCQLPKIIQNPIKIESKNKHQPLKGLNPQPQGKFHINHLPDNHDPLLTKANCQRQLQCQRRHKQQIKSVEYMRRN